MKNASKRIVMLFHGLLKHFGEAWQSVPQRFEAFLMRLKLKNAEKRFATPCHGMLNTLWGRVRPR